MSSNIGALVVDLQGKEVSAEERELLAHPLIGGIVLFTRNYESREQLAHLCQVVRKTRKTPLLIMVDQEGGRVQRFIPEFTRLPAMSVFSKLPHSTRAIQLAKDCGWLMATELLSVGIDMSLAPVLDLDKSISSVIGNRAFHSDPYQVIMLAEAFIQGMKEAGMTATGKHFPGHGSVAPDSHVAMPVDERSLADIEQADLIPFVQLIKNGMAALMAAHIVFPQVDQRAVSFSPVWLQTILRKKLGYKGAILSDDLNMEGANISLNYADRVLAAREAGCDFVLLCNNRAGVIQAIDAIPAERHQVTQDKWVALQGDISAKTAYRESSRWKTTSEFLLNEAMTIGK